MEKEKEKKKLKDPKIFIGKLIREKQDFQIKIGNYSAEIIIFNKSGEKIRNVFRQNTLSDKALFLAGSVKNRVKSFDLTHGVDKEEIKYFDFYLKRAGIYKDVCEIDVNGAYWKLAFQMGYITEKQYLKGLDLDKKERLIVLGSIATTKKVITYIDGEIFTDTVEFSKAGKAIFYNISKRLGDIMEGIVRGVGKEYFFLFWVDAFLCSNSVKAYVIRELEKLDLQCKVLEVKSIKVFNTGKKSVKIYTVEKKGEYSDRCTIKIKPFQYNSEERRQESYLKILKDYKIIK